MSSLPVVTGFQVVEWDCAKCDASNTADEWGPARCHWCEEWAMIIPRGVGCVADQKRLKVKGKFDKPKRKGL